MNNTIQKMITISIIITQKKKEIINLITIKNIHIYILTKEKRAKNKKNPKKKKKKFRLIMPLLKVILVHMKNVIIINIILMIKLKI